MDNRVRRITATLTTHRNMILVLLAGLAVRCVALANTYIVNQDGPLYIYQAQAVYMGDIGALTECGGLHSLTGYPLLIAGFYPLIGDWIVSARIVSLLFGTAMLLPIYLMARRLFADPTASVVTLLYALMPMFVGRSADVVRDPVFWCFAATGLWLFIEELEENGGYRTALAAAAFCLAFWTRVEGLVFLLMSPLYVAVAAPRNRIRKLLLFSAPLVLIVAAVAVVGAVGKLGVGDLFRFGDIVKKPVELVAGYGALQNRLQGLADYATQTDLYSFLSVAKDHIWVVALGAVIVHTAEAFFFPYLLLFLLPGAAPFFSRAKREPVYRYLALLMVASFLALTVHLIHVWMIDNRFSSILILPGFAMFGLGIERLQTWMAGRFAMTRRSVVILMLIYICAAGLFIDLRSREKDKAVFVEIGRTIAAQKKDGQLVTVATSKATQRWISFYANRGIIEKDCGFSCKSCYEKWPADYASFRRTLKRKGGDFFLYEQKRWPKGRFPVQKLAERKSFAEIGRWHHPDTGTMILYRMR